MKEIMFISLLAFTGCSSMAPDFFKAADDVLTDGVVQVQVDKEAFAEKKDVNISITITDPKEAK